MSDNAYYHIAVFEVKWAYSNFALLHLRKNVPSFFIKVFLRGPGRWKLRPQCTTRRQDDRPPPCLTRQAQPKDPPD
jgi:hypothetical protein